MLPKDGHFTTLQTLYAVNEQLLNTKVRNQNSSGKGGWVNKQIRPSEEKIEDYYSELSNYWDAILKTIPSLRNPPVEMRVTSNDSVENTQVQNHFLFRPIGQELFSKLVRNLLDEAFSEKGYATVKEMSEILIPLTKVSWELQDVPWVHLILIQSSSGRWVIRNEERKKAIDTACRLLKWIVGLDLLDPSQTEYLRNSWIDAMPYDLGEDGIDEMWSEIWQMRQKILR